MNNTDKKQKAQSNAIFFYVFRILGSFLPYFVLINQKFKTLKQGLQTAYKSFRKPKY